MWATSTRRTSLKGSMVQWLFSKLAHLENVKFGTLNQSSDHIGNLQRFTSYSRNGPPFLAQSVHGACPETLFPLSSAFLPRIILPSLHQLLLVVPSQMSSLLLLVSKARRFITGVRLKGLPSPEAFCDTSSFLLSTPHQAENSVPISQCEAFFPSRDHHPSTSSYYYQVSYYYYYYYFQKCVTFFPLAVVAFVAVRLFSCHCPARPPSTRNRSVSIGFRIGRFFW
jgi:hypothetical protein